VKCYQSLVVRICVSDVLACSPEIRIESSDNDVDQQPQTYTSANNDNDNDNNTTRSGSDDNITPSGPGLDMTCLASLLSLVSIHTK